MKRILLICAAAIVVLSCAGCAEHNNNPADISNPVTQSSAATEATTVTSPELTTVTSTQPTCAEHDCTTPATTEPAPEPTAEVTTSEVTTVETTSEVTTEATAESTTESSQQPEESGEEPIDKDYIYQDEDDFFYVVNKTYLLRGDYESETDYVQGR